MNFYIENNGSKSQVPSKKYYFQVEVGPKPETFESYMKRVFAGVGLRSSESIKAFNRLMGQAYFLYMVNNAKGNAAVAGAVQNPNGKIIKVTVGVSASIVEKLRRFGIDLQLASKAWRRFTVTPRLINKMLRSIKISRLFRQLRFPNGRRFRNSIQ